MALRSKAGTGNGANIRLAADIGGTFTDIAVFDDKSGRLTFGKALSTPERLVDGISAGVEKANSDYRAAGLFLHGSTVAINTILERTGAKTALVTTEGFRDVPCEKAAKRSTASISRNPHLLWPVPVPNRTKNRAFATVV